MLIYPKNRLYLKKKPAAVSSPPVLPLELISGVYSINDALVTLTFNQPIDISGIDVTQFIVKDGIGASAILQGNGASIDGESSVIITLEQIDSYSGPNITLDASAENGIVAETTDLPWDGVSGFVLELG